MLPSSKTNKRNQKINGRLVPPFRPEGAAKFQIFLKKLHKNRRVSPAILQERF